VTPAELGDEASVERMRHRVRLKQIGRAWTRLDAAPLSDSSPGEGDPIDELLPAIGETANRIRVVTEEDGARVAVWIDRREAWDSIIAPLKLPKDGGDAGAGVWLEAGAPVEVARGRARAGRPVELHDETVAILGSVPAAFLGHVWIVPHDDRRRTDMAQGSCSTTPTPPPPPPDRRGQMSLAEGAAIRAAASETAPVLATLREAIDVTVVARGADWAEIELRRPYARVRGHVPASDLTPIEELGELAGSCTGRMFTMSHADRIDVPAGTCLFDRANGDVVGVATETMVRLGSRGRAGDEWSMVHVNTRWSLASLYVRDTGRDPAQLALESCAPGRHRR
jgi:hypothetical protein